jgi:hypothetical protein
VGSRTLVQRGQVLGNWFYSQRRSRPVTTAPPAGGRRLLIDLVRQLPPERQREALLALATAAGEGPEELKAVLSDPDDDKVLECAFQAGATHLSREIAAICSR